MNRSNWCILPIILGLLSGVALWAQQKPGDPPKPPTPQAESNITLPPLSDPENLNSLSINGSNLKAREPVVGEKDVFPEFTRELIQVQWRTGDAIDLYIIKPTETVKPPVVLYLYGYPSETDRFRDNDYCKRITFNGYAAIGFVPALTGQRYHDRPMKEWFVSQLPEALTKSVHDVQMVLRYLAERNDLDLSRVGIFGQGSGGTIAILAAGVEPQIRTVDALEPWGDWPTWLAKSSLIPETERPAYLKPEFLAGVAPLDPVQWLGRVQAKSMRLQFVLDDTVTPAAAAQRMKAAARPPAQVVEYPTKHEQYEALGGGRAFDWIKQQLQPANASTDKSQVSDNQPKTLNEKVH